MFCRIHLTLKSSRWPADKSDVTEVRSGEDAAHIFRRISRHIVGTDADDRVPVVRDFRRK